MIRMVLLALGFVAVTVALVVMQPGASRRADDVAIPEPVVTRAEPGLAAGGAADPQTLTENHPVAIAQPQPRRAAPVLAQEDLDDQSLRKMTWETLSSLNHATGRESAPGQPGSLLHTIVRRSLDDAGPAGGGYAAQPQTYVVQVGDSLVSIAEAIYGDVNMTGPLFAANQAILARPDDLRPGQTLVLPQK